MKTQTYLCVQTIAEFRTISNSLPVDGRLTYLNNLNIASEFQNKLEKDCSRQTRKKS